VLFLYIVVTCIRSGEPATARPWESADTLEWTVPSPVPYHTFETPPTVS
jgi:cytochrome c oxidase subunit 1